MSNAKNAPLDRVATEVEEFIDQVESGKINPTEVVIVFAQADGKYGMFCPDEQDTLRTAGMLAHAQWALASKQLSLDS